jgi:tartrate dehydratase beta subunit/fumarate hydratase class I family protein
MTTELMQVYSIEVGDTLLVNGDIYTVVDTDYADEGDDLHILTLVDEEGSRKKLRAPGRSEVRLVITEYV